MVFELPLLPYAFDALEPYVDTMTMQIHHGKHHAGYINKLNKALERHPDLAEKPLEGFLADLEEIPADVRLAVRNYGGGHYNHTKFWSAMSPNGGGEPKGKLIVAIENEFGSFSVFKEAFSSAAASIFGSGWTWLGAKDGKLYVISTPNQDTPMTEGLTPILGIDMWEHAYYLKYQNRRAEYISNWWNVVNWEEINRRFDQTRQTDSG
jgi:Fe-Mn family superoxide dismutase